MYLRIVALIGSICKMVKATQGNTEPVRQCMYFTSSGRLEK